MARYDHFYTNLPTTMGSVIDACVNIVFENGAQKYQDRKDFVLQSVHNQIQFEKKNNQHLEKKIGHLDLAEIIKRFNETRPLAVKRKVIVSARGGNRRKNA